MQLSLQLSEYFRMKQNKNCSQVVLVLIGLPGCGKSSFVRQLHHQEQVTISAASSSSKSTEEIIPPISKSLWQSVNQDVYGSRQKTLVAAENYLSNSVSSVIIDRCNFNPEQRSTWINLSRRYNCLCVGLVLPHYNDVAYCSARAIKRGTDALHDGSTDWSGVCARMRSQMSIPTTSEGFDAVLVCRNAAEEKLAIDALVARQPL